MILMTWVWFIFGVLFTLAYVICAVLTVRRAIIERTSKAWVYAIFAVIMTVFCAFWASMPASVIFGFGVIE